MATSQGELAEAWKPAADFKSYTIKIRKGVKFHDGKDMTADDVVYSIDEIWKKYAAAAALTDFAGVAAPDADTVVVSFSKPTPEFFFSSLLCGNVNYIVPKHVYAGSDPVNNPANDAPVGTGPWKFKEWVRGSHFEYVKNDAYWRKDQPYLDRLIIRYVRDPAGRAAAIEAGDIHIGVFNPVEPPDIKRLTATAKFVATPKGYEEAVWSTSLEVNMRNPIFAKREVRQAMFFAVDRSLIAKTVYYGYARPGTSPISSPNKAFFTPDTFSTAFDPKKAAALLDAAGYPKKAGGKRFTLNLLAAGWFAENGKVGAIVKQGLEDVGVGINLTVPDRPTSIKRIYTDYDFDLAISNKASASEPVPSTTQYYTSDGIRKGVPFRNASGFHTDEVDALVEKIKVETDPGQAQGAGRRIPEDHHRGMRRPAAGRARVDHAGQHQGAQSLQRSRLPGGELARHLAGGLTVGRYDRPHEASLCRGCDGRPAPVRRGRPDHGLRLSRSGHDLHLRQRHQGGGQGPRRHGLHHGDRGRQALQAARAAVRQSRRPTAATCRPSSMR